MVVFNKLFPFVRLFLAAAFVCLLTIGSSAEERTKTTMIDPSLQNGGPIHVAATLKEGEWDVVVASGDISVRQGETASWKQLNKKGLS